MTKLEQIKEDIAEWSDATFGAERNYTAPLYHLKEEVQETIESGELFEYADMFILLLDSYRMKYPTLSTDDLVKQCEIKLKINKARTWGKPDENGVVKHIIEKPTPPKTQMINEGRTPPPPPKDRVLREGWTPKKPKYDY
jgi:hypothetical protein